jgi:hypothetical protein
LLLNVIHNAKCCDANFPTGGLKGKKKVLPFPASEDAEEFELADIILA